MCVLMYTFGFKGFNLIAIPKIFLRKDITLTRNRIIIFCIQKPTAHPIWGHFSELFVVYNVNSY